MACGKERREERKGEVKVGEELGGCVQARTLRLDPQKLSEVHWRRLTAAAACEPAGLVFIWAGAPRGLTAVNQVINHSTNQHNGINLNSSKLKSWQRSDVDLVSRIAVSTSLRSYTHPKMCLRWD